MKKLIRVVGKVFLTLAMLLIVFLGAGFVYESISEASDERNFPAPGKIYEVDGLGMHLNCKENCTRENNVRKHSEQNAVYLDQRFIDDPVTKELLSLSDVSPIMQATFGLKSLYTLINPHKNAVTVHRVQSAGLWDVVPAAVAAKVYGGEMYDELGKPLKLAEYIILPGKGAAVVKGDKFKFVLDRIQSK